MVGSDNIIFYKQSPIRHFGFKLLGLGTSWIHIFAFFVINNLKTNYLNLTVELIEAL